MKRVERSFEPSSRVCCRLWLLGRRRMPEDCSNKSFILQGYAWEITTSEGGWGLDQVLKSRQHVLDGIANGIDMDEWDPATDAFLEENYSSSNLAGAKPPWRG